MGGTDHHGVVLAITDRASSASKPRKDGASFEFRRTELTGLTSTRSSKRRRQRVGGLVDLSYASVATRRASRISGGNAATASQGMLTTLPGADCRSGAAVAWLSALSKLTSLRRALALVDSVEEELMQQAAGWWADMNADSVTAAGTCGHVSRGGHHGHDGRASAICSTRCSGGASRDRRRRQRQRSRDWWSVRPGGTRAWSG